MMAQFLEVGPGYFFSSKNLEALTDLVKQNVGFRTLVDRLNGLHRILLLSQDSRIEHFRDELLAQLSYAGVIDWGGNVQELGDDYQPKDLAEFFPSFDIPQYMKKVVSRDYEWMWTLYLITTTFHLEECSQYFTTEPASASQPAETNKN